MPMITATRFWIPLSVWLLILNAAVFQSESCAESPEESKPPEKYIFYMHGAWLETRGFNEEHPKHGRYEYEKIIRALEATGHKVTSEVRQGRIHPMEYAKKIAGQIEDLLEDGVPSHHIAVMGHSKGGLMTLIVASLLSEPEINYVVLAGCGKSGSRFRESYVPFLKGHAHNLRGRILSIYDSADQEAGTCREAFDEAANLDSQELVLQTGRGHGLFYTPDSSWTERVLNWVEKNE
ncbi:MAG: hypothetical protein HY584_02960 [Candidatus Omnitrophica bacterium]|nr:hypothetical protein [Candidatus Omnitrophota bacterium]